MDAAGSARSKGRSALVILVAALTLAGSQPISRPLRQVLTADAGTPAATAIWNISTLTVGSAVCLIILISHADLRAKGAGAGPWRGGRLIGETLTLIAGSVLWLLLVTFLEIRSPSDRLQVLDLLGRAASLGSVLGLGLACLRAAWLYAHAVRQLAVTARFEALIITAIFSCLYPVIWF